MATTIHKIKGKGFYSKLNMPDEYSGDKRWTLAFAPDNMDDIRATGVQLKEREPTDFIPYTYVTLRRPCQKLIRDKLVMFTAPVIYGEDGHPMRRFTDAMGQPVYSFDQGAIPEGLKQEGDAPIIGNDSDIEVRIAAYDTQQGKGHRLEAVRIINLVEFERNTESQEAEKAVEPTTTTKKVASDENVPWSI